MSDEFEDIRRDWPSISMSSITNAPFLRRVLLLYEVPSCILYLKIPLAPLQFWELWDRTWSERESWPSQLSRWEPGVLYISTGLLEDELSVRKRNYWNAISLHRSSKSTASGCLLSLTQWWACCLQGRFVQRGGVSQSTRLPSSITSTPALF